MKYFSTNAITKTGTLARDSCLRVGFVLHVMQVAGAEMLVVETIRRLGSLIEPTVLCLDAVGPLGEQLRQEGVEIIDLQRRPGHDWRVAWRMAHEVRRRHIDVLHAHQYTPFFYAALARVFTLGMPRLILTEHGRHYPDVVSWKRRTLNRLVFDRLANSVNACCAFSATSLGECDGFSPRRIEVIENGIELDRYTCHSDRLALRQKLGFDPQRYYIANVARFHPVKDQAMLLRAFATVAAVRDDVDLLLIGDGPLRGELEALTQQWNLVPRVRFLGVRSDVPDLLAAVDLFALTSVSEAASLTLLEAMASRLPVVVTEVGGNPEIVRHEKEGLLVPRGDAPATASALLRLLNDPDAAARMGAAARHRIEERYHLDRTVSAYYQLYQSLSRHTV